MHNKTKLIVTVGIICLGIIIAIVYLLAANKNDGGPESYPKSVKDAINNPVDTNENWSTLSSNDEFEISYSTTDSVDSFFITISAAPALEVSLKAEQALLQKLAISAEEACKLPTVINVPASVDDNLTATEFGLSFCPNVIHISDLSGQNSSKSPDTNSSPINNLR